MTVYKKFEELPVDERIKQKVIEMGYDTLTPEMSTTIEHILNGRDILSQMNKEDRILSYGIPIADIVDNDRDFPQTLIVCSSTERAVEVTSKLKGIYDSKSIEIISLHDKETIEKEVQILKKNPHVIVGLSEKLMAHMKKRNIDTQYITTIVIDNCEEEISDEFLDEVEYILSEMQKLNLSQTAIFSTIINEDIKDLAWNFLDKPKHIINSQDGEDGQKVTQEYYQVIDSNRFNVLCAWMDMELKEGNLSSVFILVKTPTYARDVAYSLNMNGFEAEALYFNPSQWQKENILKSIKSEKNTIIVTTNTPFKQLKPKGITHLVNFHVPEQARDYTSRLKILGSGKMISLITNQEHLKILKFEKETGAMISHGDYDLEDLIADYKFTRDTESQNSRRSRERIQNRRPDKKRSNSSFTPRKRRDENSRDRDRKSYRRDGRDRDEYLKYKSIQDGRKFVYKYKFVK